MSFIRVKNLSTDKEINLNVANIVSFEPAAEPAHSTVQLLNGHTMTIKESNRALRHAIKKASSPTAGDDGEGDGHQA